MTIDDLYFFLASMSLGVGITYLAYTALLVEKMRQLRYAARYAQEMIASKKFGDADAELEHIRYDIAGEKR